jgi:hypothetical protein
MATKMPQHKKKHSGYETTTKEIAPLKETLVEQIKRLANARLLTRMLMVYYKTAERAHERYGCGEDMRRCRQLWQATDALCILDYARRQYRKVRSHA